MTLGSYLEYEGRPAVQFEWVYPHSLHDVWRAVSEGSQLSQWFPATVALEPRVGGLVTFSGDPYADDSSGVVLVFDPPRGLAFSWLEDELHFQLEPIEEGHCRLTLTNVLADPAAAARNAAGWSVCIAELDKLIAGRRVDGPHSAAAAEAGQHYYDAYVEAGLPSGAAIPTPVPPD